MAPTLRATATWRGGYEAAVAVRGHALTIDHGWREVAETALAFVRRFV